MSKCLHLKTLLSARLVTFDRALTSCKKSSVRVLANLCRTVSSTVLGDNLLKIAKMCDISINELSSLSVKANMKSFPCPKAEEWRIPLVQELLDVKNNELSIEMCDRLEIDEYIDFLCTT